MHCKNVYCGVPNGTSQAEVMSNSEKLSLWQHQSINQSLERVVLKICSNLLKVNLNEGTFT